jgi:hypothetical protein
MQEVYLTTNEVLERGALNLIFDFSIPQSAFKSDELAVLAHTANKPAYAPSGTVYA